MVMYLDINLDFANDKGKKLNNFINLMFSVIFRAYSPICRKLSNDFLIFVEFLKISFWNILFSDYWCSPKNNSWAILITAAENQLLNIHPSIIITIQKGKNDKNCKRSFICWNVTKVKNACNLIFKQWLNIAK